MKRLIASDKDNKELASMYVVDGQFRVDSINGRLQEYLRATINRLIGLGGVPLRHFTETETSHKTSVVLKKPADTDFLDAVWDSFDTIYLEESRHQGIDGFTIVSK